MSVEPKDGVVNVAKEGIVRLAARAGRALTPTWMQLLREFGFPTLVACGLAYAYWHAHEEDRVDRKEQAGEWRQAIDHNSEALQAIDKHLVDHMLAEHSMWRGLPGLGVHPVPAVSSRSDGGAR